MKRVPLKRKPIERKKPAHKPYAQSDWDIIRDTELKDRFHKAGITECELQYAGCWHSKNFSTGWTFAHSLKRGEMASKNKYPEKYAKDIREVIYACTSCPGIIEALGNKEMSMYNIVMQTIHNRKRQP